VNKQNKKDIAEEEKKEEEIETTDDVQKVREEFTELLKVF